MAKIKEVNMIEGSLWRAMVRYSIPVILVTLVQNLFNAMDIMVLGQMADTNAVASVSATSSIIHLLVTTFFGIASGTKVVLARFLGARDETGAQKTVSTSIWTALILGGASAILGLILSPVFLTLTKCPASCYDGALLYMRIYIAAAPVIMLYNFGSSILSVSGDTQRPLYYMLVSGILNVILNFVLCLVMPQKVAAVAIATAVSQLVGALLILRRLATMDGLCRMNLKVMKWSRSIFKMLMRNGVPIALLNAIYPLANLQIQTAVNSFGPSTMAGNTAATSIESLIAPVANTAWGATTTAFVGQNLGAEKPKRVKNSILLCLGFAASLGLVCGVLAYLFHEPLLSLYVGADPVAIEAGRIRMSCTVLFYVVACVNAVLNHSIQAFGYSVFTTANSVVLILAFRTVWMQLIYPQNPTFFMINICFVISWTMMMIAGTSVLLYIYNGKYKKGKLKKL